jgi:hypothetical protein
MTTTLKLLGTSSLLAALVMVGCSGDDSVGASAVGVDHTTQALLSGDLESVNGTYGAACRDRVAGSTWSVEIATGATLDYLPLSVVLNDTACVLTLTSLHTTAGIITAVPAFALTTTYQAAASSFGSPIEFYANARLSAVSFAADFVITILYSDDPAFADDDNTASLAVVYATATAGAVPAPDYTLEADGLLVSTDVNDVVQSVAGTADLTDGPVPVLGQLYVVVDAAGLSTYADIDAAFLAATPAAIVAGLPAAAFTLVGADLTVPKVRTVIIANTDSGVRSYESIEITFNPAP